MSREYEPNEYKFLTQLFITIFAVIIGIMLIRDFLPLVQTATVKALWPFR